VPYFEGTPPLFFLKPEMYPAACILTPYILFAGMVVPHWKSLNFYNWCSVRLKNIVSSFHHFSDIFLVLPSLAEEISVKNLHFVNERI